MARKTSILCQNNFKGTDPAAIREAFNNQLAILISRTADANPRQPKSRESNSDTSAKTHSEG